MSFAALALLACGEGRGERDLGGGLAGAPAAPQPPPQAHAPDAVDAANAVDAGAAGAQEFAGEARALWRIAACGGDSDVPARFDERVVARHCEELRHIYAEYRATFVDRAMPFFAAHRPPGLPPVVVYPFGGGDLATALATFPDALLFVTISLEPAGDVRLVDRAAPAELRRELSLHRSHVERLYDWGYSRTDNLQRAAQGRLPGEVLFALSALVVHGFEPVGLRYFRIRDDGALAYVTPADLARAAPDPAAERALFENVELRFRAAGGDQGPVRTFRHVAMNLDDEHLQPAAGILRHLDAMLGPTGKAAAMTKAASHLLWDDRFSRIRAWLLAHVVWMASDSTGFPPRFARAAGFAQDAYGSYVGRPWGLVEGRDGADLRALFASSPTRALDFHYGYPDQAGHAYLIVTRR